jgi:LysM repeat protein
MAKKVKVKSGDTLSSIAKANGVSLKALVQANPQIKDPKLIRPGQIVTVPDVNEQVKDQSAAKQMSVDTAKNKGSVADWRKGEEASMASQLETASKSDVTIPGSTLGAATGNPGGNLYTGMMSDTLSKEQLAARFGIAASILNTDPSLIEALNTILGFDKTGTKKISGMITDPDLAMAVLKETDWYKKHSDDWRKYQFYKESNPATYAADLESNIQAFVSKYQQMGINLDRDSAKKLAEQAMMKSATVNGAQVLYNDKYFNQLMANSIDFSKKQVLPNGKIVYDLGGKIETIASSLYKVAFDYGYPSTISNTNFSKWLENNVRGLVAGTINPEDVDNELQSRAKSMYPGLTDQLNRGLTLREAADPWVTAIANEWEEDPRFLDLNDDFLYRVLNQQDEKGNITPMNLYQAKTMARRSPKWQYTSRAKEEYTNIGQRILQDFGFLG